MNLNVRHRFSATNPAMQNSNGNILIPFYQTQGGQYVCADESTLHQLAKYLWQPPTMASSDEDHRHYENAILSVCLRNDLAVVYADGDGTVKVKDQQTDQLQTMGCLIPMTEEEFAAIEKRSQQAAAEPDSPIILQ